MEPNGLINVTIIMQGIQTLLVSLILFHFYYTYRKRYLGLWAWSWFCYSTYFFGGLASFALITQFSASHPVRLLVSSLYLTAGYLQVPLLLLGAYELASGKIVAPRTLRRWLIWAAAFAVGLVAATTFLSNPSFRFFLRVGVHSLVSGGAFLLGAFLIFRVWSPARKPGRVIALSGFIVFGVYQLLYAALPLIPSNNVGSSQLLLYFILTETILQFWTSLGLVVWLLEDERQKASDAKGALKASEERFRAQYKGVPIPTYTWRKLEDDFILIDYNDAANEATRGKGAKFIGGKASAIYNDTPEVIENFNRCFNEQGIIRSDGEFRYKTTGELRHLEVSYVFVMPDIVMVHTRDVTEQNKAENALRESEKKFRKVLENSLDVIYQFNLETKNFDYMSPAVKELSGYEAEEFIKKGFSFSNSLVHPEDIKLIEKSVKGTLTGKGKSNTKHAIEYRLKTNDGEYRWISENRAVLRNQDNVPTAIIAAARDVTERKQAEETLKLQKTLLEAKSEASPDGILVLGTNDEIILYNRRFIEIWGIPENVLETRSNAAAEEAVLDNLVDPEKFLETASFFKQNPYIKDQIEYRLKDGRIIERYTAPVVGADETLYGRIWYFRDITERRRAEESLQRSEKKIRTILENMEEGYYEVDLAGNYTYFNRALCESLGYDKDEMTGMSYKRYTDEETAKKLFAFYNKVFTTGQPFSQAVYEVSCKDGSRRIHETSGSLMVNEFGEPVGFRGLLRDITERKLAEDKLRENDKQYRFMSEAMPQQVWTARAEGLLVYVNERCIDYFGYTENRGLDMEWQDVVHPDDLPVCAEKWITSLQTGEPYEVEFRLKRADGVYQWHLGRASAMLDEGGNIVKWIGTNTNIDELKKAEKTLLETESRLLQSQKLESVGRLAGGIAHDFNNMLTAINGYSDLTMRKLEAGSPLRRNIEEIKKAGERSAELTHQLLAFSRQQILQPKLLNLNEVITDTAKLLQRLIGEDVKLNILADPHPSLIEADPGQLTQVIMNLAVNARDAMPKGGKLTIKTARVSQDEKFAARYASINPGEYIMLSVSDTGIGMSSEIQERIFEPFFTTKEVGKGTGLGLATVYGIVKQSGGNIWVYSEEGLGTTFEVYFPLVESEENENELPDLQASLPIGTETILLVEDEEIVRNLSRQVLEECGYKVVEAANGIEALSVLVQVNNNIDLLLTDVVMPEMGGRELAERLAETHPQIRTLFMSGYTDDAVMRHGISQVGTNFIQKPFTYDTLAFKVREVLLAYRD